MWSWSSGQLWRLKADVMFTVGNDVNFYYRVYFNAGNLIGQRKVDGNKTTLFTIPYDSVNHRFLRTRHNSVTGSVTLDAAPSAVEYLERGCSVTVSPGTHRHLWEQSLSK
jgi:hypothetical protein